MSALSPFPSSKEVSDHDNGKRNKSVRIEEKEGGKYKKYVI